VNWTPETVPDQQADIATFGDSTISNVSTSSGVAIGGIVFDAGASTYTISANLVFYGDGVVNSSGLTQNFDSSKAISFAGRATAGNAVVYTNNGIPLGGPWSALIDTTNAGSATFINKGDSPGLEAAYLSFNDQASAANSTILNQQGDTQGGKTAFHDFCTAGASNIMTYSGAVLTFENSSTGASATLVADGGGIYFQNQSSGGTARIELIHGGLLNLGLDNSAPPLTIGSLEGDSASTVQLNTHQLVIGGNGLSTTYSGGIIGGGSLVKTGSGKLTLTGSSVYRGGTTITGGTLIAQARAGSATGTGTVTVKSGTLGGRGTIAGAVTIGTGNGTGAYLGPGTKGPDTITTSKALTFNADGRYKCDLSLGQAQADQVNANGVTIQSGAQFLLQPKGFQTLTVGTVFTVLDNSAATPISGTFANLADGAIINATAGNKLQASYSGGDGNDLTLTVVP
jgi:autotransporter-associated beta strand protein